MTDITLLCLNHHFQLFDSVSTLSTMHMADSGSEGGLNPYKTFVHPAKSAPDNANPASGPSCTSSCSTCHFNSRYRAGNQSSPRRYSARAVIGWPSAWLSPGQGPQFLRCPHAPNCRHFRSRSTFVAQSRSPLPPDVTRS